MTPLKKQLIDAIKSLPDEAGIDEIMETIFFKAQVMEGARQLDEGKGISHDAIKKQVAKWFSR